MFVNNRRRSRAPSFWRSLLRLLAVHASNVSVRLFSATIALCALATPKLGVAAAVNNRRHQTAKKPKCKPAKRAPIEATQLWTANKPHLRYEPHSQEISARASPPLLIKPKSAARFDSQTPAAWRRARATDRRKRCRSCGRANARVSHKIARLAVGRQRRRPFCRYARLASGRCAKMCKRKRWHIRRTRA